MKTQSLLGLTLSITLVSVANGQEVSRDNYVDWIGASAVASTGTPDKAGSHFIQWKKPIHSDCKAGGKYRSRISVEDRELFSLLLMARSGGKKVGFFYELKPSTADVPGHDVPCQVVNAWIESE